MSDLLHDQLTAAALDESRFLADFPESAHTRLTDIVRYVITVLIPRAPVAISDIVSELEAHDVLYGNFSVLDSIHKAVNAR